MLHLEDGSSEGRRGSRPARGKASAAGGRSDLGSFQQKRAGEGQYRWTGQDESKCVADGDGTQLKESME